MNKTERKKKEIPLLFSGSLFWGSGFSAMNIKNKNRLLLELLEEDFKSTYLPKIQSFNDLFKPSFR